MSVVTVFFIILITTFAVIAFFSEPSDADKRIHSRLAALDHKSISSGGNEPDIVKEVTFSTIPAFDRFLRKNKAALSLQLLIEQCDLHWTVGRIVFSMLALVAVGALLGNWWIAPGLLGWTPGVTLGAIPYLVLLQKRKQRLRRFSQMLPEAIDLMSRGLRAGQALPGTIETIATESAEPLASEFRRAADEQSFGLPFREAMMNLSRRVPVPDLQFLITAILVQKETGGNLTQILDKTSHVIRERIRITGQMRIRTAQARFSGWVLCALPFVMFIGLNALNPGYAKPLLENPTGQKMLIYAGVMMVIGMVLIRRIANVKF